MTITSFRISGFPLIKLSFEKGIKQSVEVLDLSFRVFNVYAKIKRTPDSFQTSAWEDSGVVCSTQCRSEVKKGEISGILKESEPEWTIKDGSHVDTWYF